MTRKMLKISVFIFLSQPVLAIAESNLITEANPLLFANQGIGINSEYQFSDSFSIGGDFEIFRQNPFMSNGVTANRFIYTITPKIHYYLFTNEMYGPFVGAKLDFTYSQSRISDSDITAKSNVFYVAPIIQFGYRILAKNGFTVSAYVGAGIKSKENSFDQSNMPSSKIDNIDWQNAQTKLNKNVTRFQADYGLTVGYMF
jgi:hypothetical protein